MAISDSSRNRGAVRLRGTTILRHILQAAASCMLAAQLAFAPFASANDSKAAPALPAASVNDPVL